MKYLLILLSMTLFHTTSQAALHLEPLVYYGYGESSFKDSSVDYTQDGLLFGARMGWYRKSFTLGLEYLTGEMNFENEDNGNDYDETPHYMGAYVGYNLKQRIGLNASYFLRVRSNASGVHKLSGDAWKVEAFYRVKTHFSIRLGYKHRTLDYDENSNSSIPGKFESKTVLVGLSFPWVL